MAEQPNDPQTIFRSALPVGMSLCVEKRPLLTEEEICQGLHASRVVPLTVANPHGPFGLEQVAAAVVALRENTQSHPSMDRVRRPIELPVQTWEKLHALAATASESGTSPTSAGELAAAIIERYVHDAASSCGR